MLDSSADVARKLKRDARVRHMTDRRWAGWKLQLSFGSAEQAFGPELAAASLRAANALIEQATGEPAPPVDLADLAKVDRDQWHLSASWRGGHPAEEGRRLLAELVVALGVPEEGRAGIQPAVMLGPGGMSPQVTHWIWRDRHE